MRLAGNPLIGAGSSSSSRPAVQCGRRPGSASRVCRVAAAKDSGSATAPAPTPPPKPVLNIIPQSQWANGVPPVMGAHLMASGTVAPVSTSTGAGEGVAQHTFQYAGEGEAQVVVYATAKNASAGLAKAVTEAAAAAIKAKGSFTLVLSGERGGGARVGCSVGCARALVWHGRRMHAGCLACKRARSGGRSSMLLTLCRCCHTPRACQAARC